MESRMIFLLRLCYKMDSTFYANLLPLMKNQQETIDGRMINLLA